MISKQKEQLVIQKQATPTVSIIMPAYNAANTIRDSINSVLAQTFENWELVIVDDCSQDKTVAIVKTFAEADIRVQLYLNEQNLGAAKTRNNAISQAQGEWLAFLDSDDIWRHDKLEKQLKFAEETNAKITYTSTAYINVFDETSTYVLPALYQLPYKTLLRRNLMSCSSVMVRKDVMVPFPEGNMPEDYAVWLRILKKVGYSNGLNEPLLQYRLSENSKSGKRINSAKMIYNSYRQVGYGVLASYIFTARYAIHSISKRTYVNIGLERPKRNA